MSEDREVHENSRSGVPAEVQLVEEPSRTPAYEWEEAVSEWAEGARYELYGQLRQAKAAASVMRGYGTSAMKEFAKEAGTSKSKVYDYARVWQCYAHIFEEADELSTRLETLGITHLIRSLRDPHPVETAVEAHDEGLSTRQLEERIDERERAEYPQAKPAKARTITCPRCGGEGEILVEGE